MSFPDLRAFLADLRRDRELVAIDAPVDARLEAADIHRRVIAAGGPALLFTNITGASFPLVTNLFGTAKRAERAFGTRPLALVNRLVHAVETIMPPTPARLWGVRDLAWQGLRIGTRRTGRGPWWTSWIESRAWSVCPRSPAGRKTAVPSSPCRWSTRRIPTAKARTSACTAFTSTTARHRHALADRKGRRLPLRRGRVARQTLPVTVFLGGPPALILAAIAPLPENVPEVLLASLIAGQRLRVIDG